MTPNDVPIVTFTVYQNPRDFPGRFVVRRFAVVRGCSEPVPDPEPWAVVDSLKEARASLPAGLYPLGRQNGDDPVIVETWI